MTTQAITPAAPNNPAAMYPYPAAHAANAPAMA